MHLAVPTGAAAQEPQADPGAEKTVRVVRVETPPVIDGRLDDAVWGQADVIDRLPPDPAGRRREAFRTDGGVPAL